MLEAYAEEKTVENGITRYVAMCNYCNSELTTAPTGGTGHLNRHYKACLARLGQTQGAGDTDDIAPFRSFLKARLWFPLSRFLVEVLKTFQIFLHQLTPEAIIRMGLFIWAVRSQGLEPSARCFCSMHELLYETKATGKEQYHNNFGCYGFIARSNASHPVPTFRKR